jgi:hypothetical protein
MWLRVILMSASYLYRIGQIWHTDDDAQLERDRRAMVDVVQLLKSASDGTAATQLLRLQEQLTIMHADMQQRTQDMQRQIELLTQYAERLQLRLDAASSR